MTPGGIIGGQYQLVEKLGEGGQGEVWQAVHLEHGWTHALKRTRATAEIDVMRLKQEALRTQRVQHKNVVKVFGFIEPSTTEDEPWMIMEYIPGERLRDKGVLAEGQVANIGAQLADGLAAIHRAGLLHRDINPGNVMITPDGVAKLIDLGITKDLHGETTVVGDGKVAGTPGYLAPEAVSKGMVNQQADIFALGATLYFSLTGRTPYGMPRVEDLMERANQGLVQNLTTERGIDPLINRMIGVKPKTRPSLERIRDELGWFAHDPSEGRERRRRPDRRTLRKAAIGAGAVLAVGVLGWGSWQVAGALGTPTTPAAEPSESSSARTTAQTSEADEGPGSIGEERTADPCSLLSAEPLKAYGEVQVDTDYDRPSYCNAFILEPSGAEINLSVSLWREEGDLTGKREQAGVVEVVWDAETSVEECHVEILLPDGEHVIDIDATEIDGTTATDICGPVKKTIDHAVGVVNAGVVPRRKEAIAPGSLAALNACELLADGTPAASRQVGGERWVDFGEWDCEWELKDDLELGVWLDHSDYAYTDEDGRKVVVSGKEAYVKEDSWQEDSCLVTLIYGEHPDPDDDSTSFDLIQILLIGNGERSMEQLCQQAQEATASIAKGLA